MDLEDKDIFKKFAWFIMNNPGKMIYYINDGGYGELPISASTAEINHIVAENMFDKKFITGISQMMNEDREYLNVAWDVVAVVASSIGSFVSGLYWNAKLAIFGQEQALKQGVYSRENEEIMKEHAISDAKKRMSIMLGATQADMVLKRDAQIEDDKRKETMTVFGMFAIGAVLFAVIVMKMKKK